MAKQSSHRGKVVPTHHKFRKVTPLLQSGAIEIGNLSGHSFKIVEKQLSRGLRNSGCTVAFGGLDVSVEEYRDETSRSHYAVHAHLMILSEEFAAFKRAIHPHLVSKKTARVPLMPKRWKGDNSGIAYMFQHALDRRVILSQDEMTDTKRSTAARNNPARVEQAIEIALALDKLGFEGKTILKGLRPYVEDGKAKLVRLSGKNQGSGEKQGIEASREDVDGKDPGFDEPPLSNYSAGCAKRSSPPFLAKGRAERAVRAERSSSVRRDAEPATGRRQEQGGVRNFVEHSRKAQPEGLSIWKVANIIDSATGDAHERFRFYDMHGGLSDCVVRRDDASDVPSLRKALSRANALMPPRDVQSEALCALIDSQPEGREIAVPQVGWTDDETAFVTPVEVIGMDHQESLKRVPPLKMHPDQRDDAYPRGTLREWKSAVAKPASYSSRMMMVISAAFAAPLLKAIGLQPFGLHLYGTPKTGKSAAQSAAASVSGKGGESDLASFNATDNVVLEVGRRKNDQLCVINDVSIKKGGKKEAYLTLRDLFYASSGGKARARLEDTAHHNPAAASNTRVITVTSGERSAQAYADHIGAERDEGEGARILDLPVLSGNFRTVIDMGPKSKLPLKIERRRALIQGIREGSRKYHGVALKPYVEFLLKEENKTEIVAKNIDQVLPDLEAMAKKREAAVHMARNVALIYAGGCLGIEAGILPWSVRKLRRAILRCFGDAMAVLPPQPTAEPTPCEMIQKMLDGLEFSEVPGEDWMLSECGRACRRVKDGSTVFRVHSDYFRTVLRPANAESCLRWLLGEGKLVVGKAAYVVKAGTDWAVRTPRWPSVGKKVRSMEFRWP